MSQGAPGLWQRRCEGKFTSPQLVCGEDACRCTAWLGAHPHGNTGSQQVHECRGLAQEQGLISKCYSALSGAEEEARVGQLWEGGGQLSYLLCPLFAHMSNGPFNKTWKGWEGVTWPPAIPTSLNPFSPHLSRIWAFLPGPRIDCCKCAVAAACVCSTLPSEPGRTAQPLLGDSWAPQPAALLLKGPREGFSIPPTWCRASWYTVSAHQTQVLQRLPSPTPELAGTQLASLCPALHTCWLPGEA